MIADSIPPGLIDIKYAGIVYDALNEKIIEHVLTCKDCKPGIRCMQYIGLAEVRDSLDFVEGKNQRDQKN